MAKEYEGFRGWRLGKTPGGKLRLLAGSRDVPWEPDPEFVIHSDYVEGEKPPFESEEQSKGLYSKKTYPGFVKEYGASLPIHGVIQPHGTVVIGKEGFRSTKASVKGLIRRAQETGCYICGGKPDLYLRTETGTFPIDLKCMQKFKKVFDKAKYKEWDLDTLLDEMAMEYYADVITEPKED